MATHDDAIVAARLFPGTTQLATALPVLAEAAERTLEVDADKRARTIIRLDAGGGTVEDVKGLRRRGYAIHGKDSAGQRAQVLAARVTEGVDDPRVLGRQVGWVTQDTMASVRPVRRSAGRIRKKNGQWGVGVLLAVRTAHDVITLPHQPIDRVNDPTAVLLAAVYFYDQRAAGSRRPSNETAFKEDKQGLGRPKRNKKRFAAQQMVLALRTLAHNVLVWTRTWLAARVPALAR